MNVVDQEVVASGDLSFSVESRLLRELGERLVKQPEVAIVELIKNAYDADARTCAITHRSEAEIKVVDDGCGMTLDQFANGWMRIGTSSKASTATSDLGRAITGEKGIGRFAVRFLGRALRLESVADDAERGYRTRLVATFDWKTFDEFEDLGQIKVPFELSRADDAETGTTLVISALRAQASDLDLQRVRTDSIGVLSPLSALLNAMGPPSAATKGGVADPGFRLVVGEGEADEAEDVAETVLDAYVLRARVKLVGTKLNLKVYRRGHRAAYLSVVDTYPNDLGYLEADIRFFPRRKGVFEGVPVDGRRAYSWVRENSGVAVFDRAFRVQPYGTASDDWLQLAADAARNTREPRSSVAGKHFAMAPEVKADTAENWMLRLPQSAQLVGLVQVRGRRSGDEELGLSDPNISDDADARDDLGLVASADREGFVENRAFAQLIDVVRGAVEAIAQADRRLQREQEERDRLARLEAIRSETRTAIDEVESSPTLAAAEKTRIVAAIVQTQELVESHENSARERERQLEVMSLLGIVAGFMTHEFGTALQELKRAQEVLHELTDEPSAGQFAEHEAALAGHIAKLTEFVTYSSGYVQGSRGTPEKRFPALPRIRQMVRVFGSYAAERQIEIEVGVAKELVAPRVPASLYNGIALNLYTNALKAVTARLDNGRRLIAFRAWNDSDRHFLEVSDTGVGIPLALRERVFDPLFTSTDERRDPLGSGMGLGLSLVRRGVSAFGGRVDVVDPPAGFATCVRVEIPLGSDD